MGKKKLKLFYVEYTNHLCGIRAYTTLKACKRKETITNGTRNFRRAREATEEDIKHVRGACGYVPDV